jgi:hypothetical protein
MGREFIEVMPSGFISDIAPYAVPAESWTLTRNVRFQGSSAERFGGSRLIYTEAEAYIGAPEFAFTTVLNGLVWMLYGGAWGVGVTNGTNHYDVTPADWLPIAVAGTVTGGTINNIICFNHVACPPYYWDGAIVAGSVKPLPGWPANTKANLLRPFRQHLFAGDIQSAGGRQQDLLLFSDAAPVGAVPPTWTASATNQAGSLVLADGLGAVVEMAPMHDYAICYKQTVAYAIRWVGRPYIYTFQRLAAAVGAISQNAVAVLRGSHAVISIGDIVLVDGATARSLVDQRTRKAIFQNFNVAAAAVACNVHNPARSEVWFGLPTSGSSAVNLAAVWNYNTDKWALRTLPELTALGLTVVRGASSGGGGGEIWDTQTQAWQDTAGAWSGVQYGETQVKVIGCGPAHAGIIGFDLADLELGQPFEGWMERKTMPIGGTAKVKHIQAIFPRLTATQGSTMLVRIGVQMETSDPIQWDAETTFTVDPERAVKGIPVLRQGKFLSIQMRSSQADPWTMDGFGVEYQERGRY